MHTRSTKPIQPNLALMRHALALTHGHDEGGRRRRGKPPQRVSSKGLSVQVSLSLSMSVLHAGFYFRLPSTDFFLLA
jgi:hypothetical protein